MTRLLCAAIALASVVGCVRSEVAVSVNAATAAAPDDKPAEELPVAQVREEVLDGGDDRSGVGVEVLVDGRADHDHDVLDLPDAGRIRAQGEPAGVEHARQHLVGAPLDEKLAEAPVPVEGRAVQAQVLSQRIQGLAAVEEPAKGADVAVVGAPLEQRHALRVARRRGVARGQVVEDEVRPPVLNAIQHGTCLD